MLAEPEIQLDAAEILNPRATSLETSTNQQEHGSRPQRARKPPERLQYEKLGDPS